MQAPLEKHFQARVIKKLKTLKDTWFVKIADRAKSGLPDIICCIDGNFVALELKRSAASKATPLQEFTLEQIRDAQGSAQVVHPGNWEKVFEALVTMAGGIKSKGEKCS